MGEYLSLSRDSFLKGKVGFFGFEVGVADGAGFAPIKTAGEELFKKVTVARLGDDHVGHGIEEANVVDAVMGAAIGSGEERAIEGEDDGEFLHADVLEEVVESSLEEGGVDGDDDFFLSAVGEAAGKGDGVPFGNADVEAAVGIALHKLIEARAGRHSGSDAENVWVGVGEFEEVTAEDFGKGGLGGGSGEEFAAAEVKGLGAMIGSGVGDGDGHPFAFDGHDVEEDGMGIVFERFERFDELTEVMSIDGTYVREVELFKESGGADEVLHRFGHFLTELFELGAIAGDLREDSLDFLVDAIGNGIAEKAAENALDIAHVLGNRHRIVVENGDKTA